MLAIWAMCISRKMKCFLYGNRNEVLEGRCKQFLSGWVESTRHKKGSVFIDLPMCRGTVRPTSAGGGKRMRATAVVDGNPLRRTMWCGRDQGG